MAKTLELVFTTEMGNQARMTIDDPVEPIDIEQVKNVMQQIISANVFFGNGGNFVSPYQARLVERNVVEYEIL